MTHCKSPWYRERLRAEGEEGVRGWVGWTASLMQWTWTWAKSRRWWGTRKAWSATFHGIAEPDTTGWLNNNKLLASTHLAVYVKYGPVGKSVGENERMRLSQENICCNVGNTKFMYFAHTRSFRITFCVYLLSLSFFLIPLAAPDLSCSAQDLLVASCGI